VLCRNEVSISLGSVVPIFEVGKVIWPLISNFFRTTDYHILSKSTEICQHYDVLWSRLFFSGTSCVLVIVCVIVNVVSITLVLSHWRDITDVLRHCYFLRLHLRHWYWCCDSVEYNTTTVLTLCRSSYYCWMSPRAGVRSFCQILRDYWLLLCCVANKVSWIASASSKDRVFCAIGMFCASGQVFLWFLCPLLVECHLWFAVCVSSAAFDWCILLHFVTNEEVLKGIDQIRQLYLAESSIVNWSTLVT